MSANKNAVETSASTMSDSVAEDEEGAECLIGRGWARDPQLSGRGASTCVISSNNPRPHNLFLGLSVLLFYGDPSCGKDFYTVFPAILICFSLCDGISHTKGVKCTDFYGHAIMSSLGVERFVRGVVSHKAGRLEVDDAITHLQLCPAIIFNARKHAHPTLDSNGKVFSKLQRHSFQGIVGRHRPTSINMEVRWVDSGTFSRRSFVRNRQFFWVAVLTQKNARCWGS